METGTHAPPLTTSSRYDRCSCVSFGEDGVAAALLDGAAAGAAGSLDARLATTDVVRCCTWVCVWECDVPLSRLDTPSLGTTGGDPRDDDDCCVDRLRGCTPIDAAWWAGWWTEVAPPDGGAAAARSVSTSGARLATARASESPDGTTVRSANAIGGAVSILNNGSV
jgi:hypothetical protein